MGASDSQAEAYEKLSTAQAEEMKKVEERHATELQFAAAEKERIEATAKDAVDAKEQEVLQMRQQLVDKAKAHSRTTSSIPARD